MARTQQKVESGSGGSSSRRGGGCRFVSSAAAIAVAALLPTVAAPHGCGHPDCDGGHPLRVNPLRNVPPLPKVHYSWAIYPPFLDNLTVADGALADYVRITGSLTPTDQLLSADEARTSVAICAKASSMGGCLKVGSAHKGYKCRQAGIALSMGCFPGKCLASAGKSGFAACLQNGTASLRATLSGAVAALTEANLALGENISIDAVMYDCETATWDTDTPAATIQSITTINELTYNTTRAVFPSPTRIILYGYGGAEWMPTVPHPSSDDIPHCDRACRSANITWHRAGGGAVLPLGWVIPSAYFTYLENFQGDVAYSPSLYAVAEPELMRRKFSLTAAMARGRGVRGSGEVVPYIMLGMGLRRAPVITNTTATTYTGGYTAYEADFQYDEGYDYLLGAEMHAKQYENGPYGPWEAAAAAVLFPSPFDETHYGNWPSRHTNGSTNSMDHFIAYCQGAHAKAATRA